MVQYSRSQKQDKQAKQIGRINTSINEKKLQGACYIKLLETFRKSQKEKKKPAKITLIRKLSNVERVVFKTKTVNG